jgi:hypothetical protein
MGWVFFKELLLQDIVACWLGNATNNQWVLDLALDLLDYSPGGTTVM